MGNEDSYYLNKAYMEAKNSKCLRHQVGAVLVKGDVLVGECNNVSLGMCECEKAGCLRQELNLSGGERVEVCRGVHAEQNLIVKCTLLGINPEGGTIYCTHSPCSVCAKILTNLKIKRFVYSNERIEKNFTKIFRCAGIEYKLEKMLNLDLLIKNFT